MNLLRLAALLSAVLLVSSFSDVAAQETSAPGPGNAEVIFTPEMTKADLTDLQREMAMKGIGLRYDHTVFNEEGKLKEIRFRVNAGEVKGSASSADLSSGSDFGFRVEQSKGTAAKIKVGTLSEKQE